MCSIVEDDFGDEGASHSMKEESSTPSGSGLSSGELCRKCNESQAVLKLNLKEPQCRSCFLHYVRHKFRASLGATKVVRRGSKVLVVFNGTLENVVMLDMIRHGMEQESFKKLRIVPVVLYVCEDFLALDQEKHMQVIEEKLAVLKQFDLPSYYTTLGASTYCSVNENDPALCLKLFQRERGSIQRVFNGIRSITSKQDFIIQTRKQTYKDIAKELECPYIFLSDIGLDLAKILLANIALGRGRSVSLDVAFCDDRDEERKIIRPMRDLNLDELENYLKFAENQLTFISLLDPFQDKPSLQNLTSKFIDGLQQTFPSTVSTVFRTGDKLGAPKLSTPTEDMNSEGDLLSLFDKSINLSRTNTIPTRCKFCNSALDYHESATLFATEFSRMVSSRINVELSHEKIVESTIQMKEDAGKAVNGELQGDEMGQLKKELCHSCRNIFVDFDGK